MQFNFNFEAFEKSGKDKKEAINYLKGLNSSLDFDKLESDLKGDENAIYEALKGGNFSFSKPSIEQTRQKLLKNKENEALKAEFNTSLSWLDNKQDYNFYDFKKAKERANSKQGLIKADLEAQEKELKRKEALFEKRLKNESIFTKSLRDTADNLGLNAVADTLEMGLNKLGFKDENYIFESEKEDIKKRALKGVREKLQNNEENFSESEKYALRDKYDELDYKKALEKEKEKLRLIQKDSGYNKSEVEFMEEELGFFHTLFNEAKDTVREFKDEYKSEGVIGADVQKAVNVLKQFEESELLRHIFSDKEKKQELQQEYLKNALVIAELNGFDDVGLSRENELYFIKKDKDKEQKYLVNTGFLDNFWDLIENSKFEIAGGVAGGIKGFNSGKSAKGKVVKSVLGAAAGSFGGALMDAKIADMYLNRESNYKRNLEYALQAGLLSIAGDGVIIAAKPMAKGVAKGVKNAYAYAKERTPLGLFSTIPSQNINAANKIIDEVFTPEMKEELKQAQKEYGGGVRGADLANPVFEKLKESFVKKYGKEDIKTQKIAKLAEIFNQNSLKTKQQEMLDLIRSDKDGSTLAYLLEVAKDDVKIQNNLKNMLNLASLNVEKNLKNLNINPREIKSILDEFEAGNKAAFKEVESQISKLYNEDIRVVLDRTQYENIKKDFLENGVNLDEMTPFLRDLENNVFAKEGVTFAKLNNFRKNLNYYIFNKDKTPNFINTLKKISETSLKAEIDKGIDNIFNELPNAYASIKELYSTSLKDYAAMKELNESIKNLKLQDSAKSADEVVDSLIKYAKGQGENGVNNLQKIKDYLGEENNAFLEMQILNRLFKESVVENDRAKVRIFDSEGFLNRVRELVGDTPAPLGANLEARALSGASQGPSKQENFIKKALNKDEAKLFLENLNGAKIPKKLDIEGFLKELESVENKENFISHLSKKEDAQSRLAYLNLVEPTLKEADLILHNGKRQDYIKKFNDGKDFFTLLITEENGKRLITFLPKTREDFIKNKIDNASLIQSFTSRASKQGNGLANESITQPLFKSKEARDFLEELSPSPVPKQISIDEFLNTLENFKNKENFLKHIEKDPKRKDYLNLIEPTLKEPDIAFKKLENGVEKEKFIKKFSDGKDFFYLLATKDNKETILTAFKTDKINTILKEFNADIIPTFIRQGSKGKAAGTTNEGIITQPLFKSKEAREFLELVEGFHKLYKNDAIIAKNFTQGTASQLSTSIATSAEGAIKQKVVKGGFDPIFRLLPDGILFGLFSKQIQGGALRYHLRKALSRSLNYDDFKLKLERELKRRHFNSNTSRLIEKFMQNLEDFNAEKEAKLARIREEELQRQEAIYKAQEANNLKDILEAEESPLKEDFGVNFEGFKGKEAVLKLLSERKGQVKGAFYKEGLGEIDLVWGEVKGSGKEAKGYGLSKIIEKHSDDFKEFGEGLEGLSKGLDEIITKGKIHTQEYGRKTIIYHKNGDVYKVGLKQNWKGEPTKNSWVITGYKEDREADKFIHSSDFTKGETLPLNSKESIAQKGLSADEAISILQSIEAKQVPKELDIEGFLKELESVENKENFITHLSKKEDAKSRLAYLNLVKPTLEEADLILKTKNKFDEPTKEFIKAFQDENKRFFYIVITEQDNERKLLTAFKTNKLRELKNRIEKARDFGEISSAHRFFKSPTAENILKQKSLNLTEKLYLKDNDTPLNVEYKIVNKDDIKPSFTLSKTQYRSEKQEELIEKIKNEFNPDLLVNIRGDLKKGNPIITQNGEVLSGNHRAAALKELEGENLSKYQKAVKEAFGVELKENEMLVRVADTSEAEIRRFSAASNEGLENNLGEQGVSLFAKYQDKIKALKEAKKPFVADDVYNLKYLVNKALGETSITKENDTSKALFASLARGRNNTILKALNELEKENLEQVSKVANMFFDNAGAFYNLTHDLDMPKMQNLQNYFSDVLVSAAKADFTRAEDFTKLNEDIRAFLDSGDKNAMFKLSPNLVSDLLTKALGAGFARFARLENPSSSLFDFLNGLKAELIEKGAPDLFSGGKGIKLNERDEFDFAKELILKGQDSEAKFKLYGNLEELKAWKSKSSLNQLTKELKHKMLERLKPLFKQEIYTKDGFKGVFNLKSLSKMTSDKAIQKSINNGFSKEEHLRAVLDIERLFKNANLAKTYNDEKGGKNVLIHRFNSEFENANALITTKESLDKDLNKIYSLELELTPRFSDEVRPTDTKSNTGDFNSQEHMADENIATIAKTDEESIAQKATKQSEKEELERQIPFIEAEIQNEALTSKAQKAWLEAFGLKSLEEAYIPNFKAEVKEAINRVLGGEEIKLTKGSFEKLVKRDREEFLPYIKDTLEKANAVIKQVDGALIFAKDYRNERLGKFFASVSRNDEGEWIITSNAPKNLNNLKNKLNEGGELLYSDLPELTIIAKPDLDANALNSEANLKDIIPQKANLEAVNKQKDKEFLEAYEKADFKGKVELAKQDIDEEIKFLEKQKEEFKRIIQQKDYNDIELEQARKILENAKEEVEGHYRIKYMQNGKEMRAYISKTDYFNQGKILSKDEILHKIIQKTIYKDKIENIKKTSDKLKKQIKIIDEYLKEYGDNEAGAISDDIIEKFKYYDFAKNAGKGAVIIGERRKGLYEQAQKVLNSRLLKAKKRATQSKKNYNITYDEARKLFYKGDMSEEQKELFQSVLPIAQKLNVRIRTAIREPYEDMIKDTTNIAGMYRYELNTATLKKGGNYTDTQRAETLLHELIHSVTSRAMSLHKTPLRDKMLSKTQIKAIDEIDQIYKKLYKFKKTFKLQDENGADLYGIKNSHEMLAELANPMFSSKLKEIGLYEKLVNNIMKIILSVRDFIRLRSDKNVYEKLKQCLKDIIENYKDDFTQEYEKQNIRDFTLTSQTQKEQIYTQRQEIKNTLKAKINQAITNENTGEKAILTNKGISKMLSDKAISKSVDNGFSREEHLRAVGVVDELFKRAKRAFSKRDEKDKNLSIYRYNAPFKNANALMTLKEYKQNGKRIYSLELENLEAAKFNPSGKDLAEQLSKSKDADTTTFHTPIDNPDESIAQKSNDIYHSNPHLGAGLVGGVLNGVEQDENGNLSFDPAKFAMGFLGGSGGSFALKKGFQILEKNPELKEKIINELADTLAQGFEKAREKYPLLSLLEPRYIVKNEKGRKIQAKVMLKEAEKKAIKQEKEALEKVLGGSEAKAEILKDLNNADEILAVLLKGYQKKGKGKGAEHIRLEHTLEPTQEGYLTRDELLDMGVKMREFIQKQGEPFMETNAKGEKARIYEWQDDEGVRFRIVTNTKAKGGNIAPSPLADEIITFYSDRNLKEKMNFKNPLLKYTIAESTMQGEALSKELESKEANTHTLREQTKELLKPFTHKLIKNKNDNTKAIVTMSGIKEMLSAKAINQSVKNGFKAKQHIKAVMALPTLFENAVFKYKQAQRHFKDYVEAYRVYSADFEGGKAIISVQERKIGNDVLYFLKLDELRLNNA